MKNIWQEFETRQYNNKYEIEIIYINTIYTIKFKRN